MITHRMPVGAFDRFAATDDLRAAIASWHDWLASERRCSPHTLAAYGRRLGSFLDFLAGHAGRMPSLASLDALEPADFRAFLASIGNSANGTRAQAISVLRNFFRFLERRELGHGAAITLIRTPKVPRSVPKALTIEGAEALLSAAAEAEHPWQTKTPCRTPRMGPV